MNVAIVLTCHDRYLKWVNGAMDSIDGQVPAFVERVLVLDDCLPPALRPRWSYVTGVWHSAAGALNAGTQRTSTPWLICWDADNVMPPGYLAAMIRHIEVAADDVAMIYPDLQFVDAELRPQQLEIQMKWSYWSSRIENPVDTAAAWRRNALDLSGGWTTESMLDDFSMALRLSAAGWRGMRCDGPPVIMRRHDEGVMQSLRRTSLLANALWRTYSVAILTAFHGDVALLEQWTKRMLAAELPYRSTFRLVSVTDDRAFIRKLALSAEALASGKSGCRVEISVLQQPQLPLDENAIGGYAYAATVGRVTEDTLLTLSESIAPPPSAFRLLGEELCLDTRRHGAIAAIQPHPHDAALIDAEIDATSAPLAWSALAGPPFDVAFAGGACTLWARWILDRKPIRTAQTDWSRSLCLDVQARGSVVRLHTGVRSASAGITTDYSINPYRSSSRLSMKQEPSATSCGRCSMRRKSRKSSWPTMDPMTARHSLHGPREQESSLFPNAALVARSKPASQLRSAT